MNLENLHYAKGEGIRKMADAVDRKLSTPISGEIGGIGAIDTDYSKGEPKLEVKIIYILSGGSEREKDYFKPIIKDRQIRNVKIAFRSRKGQGLKPYELISLANEFSHSKKFVTEENVAYNIENGDILYLIQDVDEFGSELATLFRTDYDKDMIKWIVSNPSFEVWLFYHYFDNPSILGKGLELSEKDRSNWLKEYLHKIIPGGVQSTQAFHKAEVAILNSRKNYSEEGLLPSVYSTQMHILAEEIIGVLGKDEYKAMNERRSNRIASFRAKNKK